MSQLEALVAIAIFFMIFIFIIGVVLIFQLRDHKIERQEERIAMRVIIDNFIDIVSNQKYGNEDEQE